MARPKKRRRCSFNPAVYYFKPRGVPMYMLEEVVLEFDELTALKLADSEKYYHSDAAEKMDISRATFGRILETARFKLAEGIIKGKAIKIPELPPEKLRGKIKHKCKN